MLTCPRFLLALRLANMALFILAFDTVVMTAEVAEAVLPVPMETGVSMVDGGTVPTMELQSSSDVHTEKREEISVSE